MKYNKVVLAFVDDEDGTPKVVSRLTLAQSEFFDILGCIAAHYNFIIAMSQNPLIRQANQSRLNAIRNIISKLFPYLPEESVILDNEVVNVNN